VSEEDLDTNRKGRLGVLTSLCVKCQLNEIFPPLGLQDGLLDVDFFLFLDL